MTAGPTAPHPSGPLAGSCVVVTRPKGDRDALAEALRAAGAQVVAFPVVEIADPADGGAALTAAIAALGKYQWVAFTSANAVERFLAFVPDLRVLVATRLAAVGAATAAALSERQLVPDLVASRPDAEGLVEAFPLCSTPGAAVLFPASARAARTLPDGLRAKGWAVDEVVAYRTLPAPAPSPGVVRELGAAAALTFASPSAVEAYVALRDSDGRPLPVAPVVACIGPVTGAAARAAGLDGVVLAQHASAEALVAALAGALPRRAEVAPQ